MKRLLLCLLPLCLMACQREAPAPQSDPAAVAAQDPGATAAPVVAPELKDVFESDPRFIVGITYSPEANKYPGLALELHQYVEQVRADLMTALEGAPDGKVTSPYDLSLVFTTLVDNPQIIAIGAEGSSYTGGAHGAPLLERFVWLPTTQQRLRAKDLIPEAKGWRDVSAYVREQLHAALSQRIDADELEPAERAEVMRSAGRMIDAGSDAEAENFEQFEPVPGTDGKLVALRFVFPPYQVGPYSDGVQSVEVPASVLLPHVAPAYKSLFVGG
ncbi:DUF3298 and DUF4163 domain-containing protein [Luteimonas sp. RIT-PG2_3]